MSEMQKYEFSHQPNGPFMAFKWYSTAQAALEMARASFEGTVYIAKMRELSVREIMLSPELMWGQAMEYVSELFGSSVASVMEEAHRESILAAYDTFLGHAPDGEKIWVPDRIVKCPPTVLQLTAASFDRGQAPHPSKGVKLSDLL